MDIANMTIEDIVKAAQQKAKAMHDDKLKTNQLRNFYSSITRMRADYEINEKYQDIERQLVMLQPKLAYAAGRQAAVKHTFYPLMTEAIQSVINARGNKDLALKNFFALVESLVAYHKFEGDN